MTDPTTTAPTSNFSMLTRSFVGSSCQRCGKREATETFSEGGIAYVHGLYVMWCKRCVLTEQLKHALERSAAIPELQRQLAELENS